MEYLGQDELNLPGGIWSSFACSRPPVYCPAGYLIYLQDTQATCFYYLKQGRVKSYIQSPDGEERVLNVYQAGALFGEASFFDELPRVSSAVALTPCQLIPIDRELVTQEIAQNPDLAMAMLKYLSRTVRLLSRQVDDMAFRPAHLRVARFLLTQAKDDGQLLCTQDDIAASVSVSRVTVSRILNQFSRQGWVALGYRELRLLDQEALEQFCRL